MHLHLSGRGERDGLTTNHYSARTVTMVQHTADARAEDARAKKRSSLLRALGAAVRATRTERGLTLRVLAEKAHVSERFLVQLEMGEGNISVARLQDVAEALETTAAILLSAKGVTAATRPIVALLGLRGAGKTTIGQAAAKKLGVPFVELDALVAREADGMSLSTIFEIHGEAYYRRVERETLRKFLDATEGAVLATGGSLVTSADTYELLRRRTTTVWLKANARDHWDRVVRQGDVRPMKNRANAMAEMQALLRARKPLYAQADHVVDTSSAGLDGATRRVLAIAKG